MILIIICLFIWCGKAVESNCFNLNENSQLNGNKLTVTGKGKMCDCSIKGFEYNFNITTITTITFRDEIISIGKGCFANFESLEIVQFGNNNTLKAIDKFAFYNTKIKQITIPSSVLIIGESAFENCKELELVTFENSNLRKLGSKVFGYCNKLTSFHIPKYLSTFSRETIEGSNKITEITVDSDNKYFSVEDNIVYNKNKTQLIYYSNNATRSYLKIVDSVEIIESGTFLMSSIETIVFPKSLKRIKKNAFYMNYNIKSLTIPNSVELIESAAFAGCKQLETISLLSDKIEIQENAFFGCLSLHSVIFIGKNLNVKENVFEKCDKLTDVKVLSDFDGSVIGGKQINKNDIIGGNCGDNCRYIYDKSTGVMTIIGNGSLTTFDNKINETGKVKEIKIE